MLKIPSMRYFLFTKAKSLGFYANCVRKPFLLIRPPWYNASNSKVLIAATNHKFSNGKFVTTAAASLLSGNACLRQSFFVSYYLLQSNPIHSSRSILATFISNQRVDDSQCFAWFYHFISTA